MDFVWMQRKIVKSLFVYLAPTVRCGLGLFTARSIKKGSVVIEDLDGDYAKTRFSYEQVGRMGVEILEHAFQVGRNEYALPDGNLDDFMNHSCWPNTGIRLVSDGYRVMALRDIAAHEELTYDYSTYMCGSRETFACQCSSKKCRGVIGDFMNLPKDLQQYYLEWGVVGDFVVYDLQRSAS